MIQIESALIVCQIDKEMSDNYVLPQQIKLCNTKDLHYILDQINDEVKQLINDQYSLSDHEVDKISDQQEIMFFEGSTIVALRATFPNIVLDKTYYVNEDMIKIIILQQE